MEKIKSTSDEKNTELLELVTKLTLTVNDLAQRVAELESNSVSIGSGIITTGTSGKNSDYISTHLEKLSKR